MALGQTIASCGLPCVRPGVRAIQEGRSLHPSPSPTSMCRSRFVFLRVHHFLRFRPNDGYSPRMEPFRRLAPKAFARRLRPHEASKPGQHTLESPWRKSTLRSCHTYVSRLSLSGLQLAVTLSLAGSPLSFGIPPPCISSICVSEKPKES
jgi:hypothetical protein